MQQRLASLVDPPILFAHRGARAHAPENTLEAFLLALRLGATGIESDVWCTVDGVAVLDHDGEVRSRGRRRPIADIERSRLPGHVPSLAELLEKLPAGFPVSLDVKSPEAYAPTLAVLRETGFEDSSWLCHPDWNLVASWRGSTTARLVDSTRLARIKEGPERRLASLRDAGIDALNMHHTDWNGGLVTLAHRFDRFALGWDMQHDHVLDAGLRMGMDGVFSDWVDRLVDAARRNL